MSRKREAHHGGAWKVAYADFVTAMMALFLVLWLASQDQKIKEAVQRSFRNPFASVTKESTGIIPNKDSQAVKSSTGNFDSASAIELNMLRKLANDLLKTLESNPEIMQEEKPLSLEITPDGMRISVFDRNRKPLFESETAEFTKYGSWILSTLAWEVSRFAANFSIEIEGHTEQGHLTPKENYDNWHLSTDRANAARRKLVEHSVNEKQIRKVAGFADTVPMPNVLPQDESNRRVAILLKMKSGSQL
jgi:chemotaxis protein MotB